MNPGAPSFSQHHRGKGGKPQTSTVRHKFHYNCSVPHPIDFFLSTGWESTNLSPYRIQRSSPHQFSLEPIERPEEEVMPADTATAPAAQSGAITLGGDLTVNRLGYGAMRITGKGIWGPPEDRAAAIATLRRAVELGVNFIDTADSYGPFVSEELIAEALAPYPAGLVITTKVGWTRHGAGVWQHNASPTHIAESVEGSLKRLRLDRIDVYQLHVPDPATSFDASMEAMARLQEQGKVRHVALSNVTL